MSFIRNYTPLTQVQTSKAGHGILKTYLHPDPQLDHSDLSLLMIAHTKLLIQAGTTVTNLSTVYLTDL